MNPEDVPETILDVAWRAELARRSPGASPEMIEEYCDFDAHPSLKAQREELRPVLAAALTAHERQVRDDERESTLAEFERFTVNRIRLSVEQTVSASFVAADRAKLYEEFRERIEERARQQVAVYIAEEIWFGDNPVDGRRRIAVCASLDDAVTALREDDSDRPDLVATEVTDSALGSKTARTWAVHERGGEPDDEGHLWITCEQVATESAVLSPADLAEILDYVVGRGDVRVVRNETLDRAFAALKATLPREVTP